MSDQLHQAIRRARELLDDFDHDLNDGDIQACIDNAVALVTAAAVLHGTVVRLDERDFAEAQYDPALGKPKDTPTP